MGIKSFLSKPLADFIAKRIYRDQRQGIAIQDKMLSGLIRQAAKTRFGKDHHFNEIKNQADFAEAVPIRDYESFSDYINEIRLGKENILWPGKPLYLSKTSGTTSGIKYIPISKDSISNHIDAARNALLLYISSAGNASFVDGKMIFLSGSPALEKIAGIPTGRLSGIVNHHVPGYLRSNQLPSYQTNCIEDWEAKVDAIVRETINQPMTLISGIPPWVQMYFDKLVEKKGMPVKEIFPYFSLFVYGGVNYEPYRKKMEDTIGKKVNSLELYPASEGFIGFQDLPENEGLLLNLNAGIYFEFIEAMDYFNPDARRFTLDEVKTGINYALLLTTNAGLWRYSIGDTIKFVSISPFRLVVTGRIKHFISAFGEHVIAEEVEKALQLTIQELVAEVVEFTIAPQVTPPEGLPYHEWFVEFGRMPADFDQFSRLLDENMQKLNIYYKDLVTGSILRPLRITVVRKNGFIEYMKTQGKLGGQHKLPRLSNDRVLADKLAMMLG